MNKSDVLFCEHSQCWPEPRPAVARVQILNHNGEYALSAFYCRFHVGRPDTAKFDDDVDLNEPLLAIDFVDTPK